MSDKKPDAPSIERLPFWFYGQEVIETSFSLTGTIKHPEAQPLRAYTQVNERRYFVVVAFTNGQSTDPIGEGNALSWANKLRLSEAFEISADEDLDDVGDAEALVERLRDRVRSELGQALTGDKPDHAPTAVKKARADETKVTITGPGGQAVDTTVGAIKKAAARTRRAARAKAS